MGNIKYKLTEGKDPRTEEPMFFATIVNKGPIKIKQIAAEVSENCTASEADVRAIISKMEESIIKCLQNGTSVKLDQLGTFCPTVRSRSAKIPQEFTAKNIKKIGVRYTPDASVKHFLSVNNPLLSITRVKEKEKGEVSYN